VLAQFMVVVADEPIGIVSCYEPDLRNGTASIAVHAVPEVRGTGRALLGLSSFVDYLFATFPLRKLYAEVLADNMGPFARASGVYEIEGIFRAHEYVDGRYSDLHVLAVHRERWIAHRQAVERFAAG
jgi:RimJ/RimL family protein N-acetyltransferase